MDITRLSTDLGVTKMSKEHYEELRNLNLLDIPGIKKCLIEREKMLGHAEDKIENNINVIAKAITTRVFTDSRIPQVKWLGTKLRRMVGYQLGLLGYTQSELAVIFDVSPYTIRTDIRSNEYIPDGEWWRVIASWEKIGIPVIKEWDYTSTSTPHDEADSKSGVKGGVH